MLHVTRQLMVKIENRKQTGANTREYQSKVVHNGVVHSSYTFNFSSEQCVLPDAVRFRGANARAIGGKRNKFYFPVFFSVHSVR